MLCGAGALRSTALAARARGLRTTPSCRLPTPGYTRAADAGRRLGPGAAVPTPAAGSGMSGAAPHEQRQIAWADVWDSPLEAGGRAPLNSLDCARWLLGFHRQRAAGEGAPSLG